MTSSPKSITIVGGGVIGLTSAYYLRRAGLEVTVVDQGVFGGGCSFGNLGWVCPSISWPLPAPSLGFGSLVQMLNRDAPLHIRPSSLLRLAPWLLAFRSHCNRRDFESGSSAFRALNAATMRLYDELNDDLTAAGFGFEGHSAGLTFVARTSRALETERTEIETFGVGIVEEWDAATLADREPGLPSGFAGAIHVPTDRHVRADTLCMALRSWLETNGVQVVQGFTVTEVVIEDGSVTALGGPGDAGSIPVETLLLSAGAETGGLTRAIGFRLPIQAGKGYSLTVHDPAATLRSPLYLCDQKVGLTPFDGCLRVGGTMEISGINRRLDRRRIESIRRVVTSVIPNALDGSRVDEWVGMRPLTPDGVPVIGQIPSVFNAYVATGHQMLGVTLAPSTGALIAALVTGEQPEIDPEPFSPARFA